MFNIFEENDYRSVIRRVHSERKSAFGARFTLERMAKACKVQVTYLSRVLSGKGSLSEDQLHLASGFLGLNADERRYLFLLRSLDQTALTERKDELRADLRRMQKEHVKTERHIRAEMLAADAPALSEYYLDPEAILVHIFLAVPRFAADLDRIVAALGLEKARVTDLVLRLERMGLIERGPNGYVVKRDQLHLSTDAPLYRPHRTLQRLKALERIQRLPDERCYNFSVVFSADEDVRAQIRSRFNAFIKDVQRLVGEARDEEVFQINFDLFDWSR